MSPHRERAVFLSYASQDAQAAKRICEALRAVGVEVWFDQNELVGGDAWDAKIRKQIKDCTLFVPIISTNSQARTEGYFRLEWRIADQRTHLMAKGRPFLLPVVIDDTRDADAHVPDSFTEVQWTRLAGGEANAAFCARVQTLLGGSAVETGRPRPDQRDGGVASPQKAMPTRPWLVPAVLGATVIAALALWRPWRETEKSAPPAPRAATTGGSAELARVRARLRPDAWTNADFQAVAPTLDRLLQANPEDADAWALRSIAHSLQVIRNLDSGTKPLELGKQAADRALRLAPSSPLAEISLGMHLTAMISRGGDVHAAPPHVARGLGAMPPDTLTRYAELTSFWLGYQFDDAQRSAKSWLAAEPRASFPAWILAQWSLVQRQPSEVEKWAMQAASDTDITGVRALVTMFESRYYLQADLPAARATLDRVSGSQRAVHRVVASRWLLAMAERHYDQALQELARTPEAMLFDRVFHGPKSLLAGFAHQAAGRSDVALAQFRESERLLREELTRDPENQELRAVLALTLACLDRASDARSELAAVEPLMSGREPTVYTGQVIALIAQTHGVLGETEKMTPWLRRLFSEPSTHPFSPASLRLDPRFGRYAAEPPVQALLAEFASLDPAATAAAPVVDDKSVAVLAFSNLSDDKANEYFSDGISEELLNVLAKVPGLKVSARTSAFFFKGKQVQLPEIAKQLRVAYIVEGSVRKSGSQVRITARLSRADTAEQVWSENFNRELKDIFAVQDEIAGLIAKNLKLTLEMTPERTPASPEAYGLLLQGRFFARQESNAGRKQAIEFYRRAIGMTPGYALAWAEMAQAYISLARFGGMMTADGIKEARMAAQRSLALDPDQPIALDALGWVQRTGDWDWRGAQRTFKRALALAPDSSALLTDASILYFNVGRVAEAVAFARQAAERDPLNAMAQINLADLLMQSGGIAESIEVMNRGLKLAPEVEEFRSHLAIALTRINRFAEADALNAQEPNEGYRLWGRGIIAGLRQDRAAVTRAREALIAKRDASMTGYVAMLYAAEGNRDEALALIERTLVERDSTVCWLKTAFFYDPLHRDPRWTLLLRKLGLADDQLK